MSVFGTNDYIFMPLIVACLAGAIFCGVKDQWIGFGVTLAAVLGFIAAWLATAIPRWLRRSYFLYTARGVSFFSYPGSPKPFMAEAYREMDVAAMALAYLVPDSRSSALWNNIEVYFVPDIREKCYRGLPYPKVAGLDFGNQKLVEYKTDQSLKDTALAHELCHIEAVHKKYPGDFEQKISEALRYARGGK